MAALEPEDSGDEHPHWVTLRDAAERTGLSVSTLRKQYGRGAIRSKVVKGRHGEQRLVALEDIRPAEDVAAGGADKSDASVALGAILAASVRQNELSSEMAKKLAAASERAGRAEVEAAFLREELARARAELERLRALLATRLPRRS